MQFNMASISNKVAPKATDIISRQENTKLVLKSADPENEPTYSTSKGYNCDAIDVILGVDKQNSPETTEMNNNTDKSRERNSERKAFMAVLLSSKATKIAIGVGVVIVVVIVVMAVGLGLGLGGNGEKRHCPCEQICYKHRNYYTCSCEDGYTLETDGKSCVVLTTPEEPYCLCEQICDWIGDNYTCSCLDGHSLDDDEIHCVDNTTTEIPQSTMQSTLTTLTPQPYVITTATTLPLTVALWTTFSKTTTPKTSSLASGGTELMSTMTRFGITGEFVTTKEFASPVSEQWGSTTITSCPCEQVCDRIDSDWVCACHIGYELTENQVNCADIDECETDNGGCEQNCTNTIGSYYCFCQEGMIVQEDGLSCNYDYDEVLRKSLLFYEAQRSGVLPDNNRILWRGDSAVNDATPDGKDLSGGYYDAGDHLKLGLPMAYSATVLAWGFIQFEDAYEAAGEVDHMLENLRWFADYFKKCHTQEHEFYAHVGSVNGDHGYWGRAEDMTMDRPAYKVDEDNPGSDVVGGTAAALAAIAFVFKDRDAGYSETLLYHARELFLFADDFREKYSTSIPEAAKVYDSSGYIDEIIWAACWLYKATNETFYLNRAIVLYNNTPFNRPYSFGWNDVTVGYRLMLLYLTGDTNLYKSGITTKFLSEWLPGGSMPYTPKGLVFRDKWGSLRYATAAAFIALVTAEAGVRTPAYRDWAKSQIHYVLGDTGRSFVVGYGVNPPVQPHHRGSSCPNRPAACSTPYLSLAAPNPQVLYGALVGGPDETDHYRDMRQDYFANEVTLDYNAGFQSAVAGLRHLQLIGVL